MYNPSKKTLKREVRPPRDTGRGRCLDSAGIIRQVSWAGGNVLIDGVVVFALAENPQILDFSFDSLDRAVVCWQTNSGDGFVRFFDPVPNAYVSLNCGQIQWPAIHNDYLLLGNDIKFVYLVNNFPFYRQHVEKFAVVRPLEPEFNDIPYSSVYFNSDKFQTIQFFGLGVETNSLNVVGLLEV